jgi:hypothetical protein
LYIFQFAAINFLRDMTSFREKLESPKRERRARPQTGYKGLRGLKATQDDNLSTI